MFLASKQADLFEMRFNGADYQQARDNERLVPQHLRILKLMKDGEWRTLQDIAKATSAPTTSVSAQLRHLRKDRFGGHTVKRKHMGKGVYQYQLIFKE